jgi:hypothetical protein
MTPAEQLYGAGSPTSHLACQPGIHRAPTKRRFLAVVGASRACPTASVSCWRTLQRVAPRFGAGAVAGYAVMRVDPAVIAPDDQGAPTGEVAPVPESLTMPAGADMALAFG